MVGYFCSLIKANKAKYISKEEETVKFLPYVLVSLVSIIFLHTFSTVLKINIYRNTYSFELNTVIKFHVVFGLKITKLKFYKNKNYETVFKYTVGVVDVTALM